MLQRAYSLLVAQTKLIIASPLLIVPPFHHIPVSLETNLEDLVFALLRPGLSISEVTEPIRGRPETCLGPLQPISREGNTGAYPKYSFSGMSQTSDSIHYTSETGIHLHQYPRQVFMCTQSSRPSETVVGVSDGLHLLGSRENILTKTFRDSSGSGESSGYKRSVEFHSIPPVPTVDGVYDKSRFSSLSIASTPARDLKLRRLFEQIDRLIQSTQTS